MLDKYPPINFVLFGVETGENMKKIPLLQFSYDFCLSMPELLDCNGQEPPCLVIQTKENCYRLSRFCDGSWREINYFFDPTKEQLNFLFSKNHGVEIIKQKLSPTGYGKLIGRERLSEQMVIQKTEFDTCAFFYGYVNSNSYLCLEKQNGPIVCRSENGLRLWQTEETYAWPGNHWPTITKECIEIFDFDRNIICIYSLSGDKRQNYRIPKIFQNTPYDLCLCTDNISYYLDGFGEDISKYLRVYLDRENKVETLFTLPDEVYVTNCSIRNHKFLFAGEEYRGPQYGDVGVLISRKSDEYIINKLFFHPSVQRDVGGGEIKWIDDEHFFYWKPSNRTTLFCYNIKQNKLFQLGTFYYLETSNVVSFQNQVYILEYKDHKANNGRIVNRDYFFSVLVDKPVV